jgi:hypothetical protein
MLGIDQRTFQDITDEFEFIDEFLLYVDEPFEGYLRSVRDQSLVAFVRQMVVPRLVWHWSLIPVQECVRPAREALDQTSPLSTWLSIVEDRRGPSPTLSAAWVSGPVA